MNMQNLSDFLRRKMFEENLSTYEIARRSGGKLKANTVTRILNGDIKEAKLTTLEALAKGLRMDFIDIIRLLNGSDLESPFRFELYAEAFSANLSKSEWQYLETFFRDQVKKWVEFQNQREEASNQLLNTSNNKSQHQKK